MTGYRPGFNKAGNIILPKQQKRYSLYLEKCTGVRAWGGCISLHDGHSSWYFEQVFAGQMAAELQQPYSCTLRIVIKTEPP